MVANEILEVTELLKRVEKALSAMKPYDDFTFNVKEHEVKFRYDSVVGMLLMAKNDISDMKDQWIQEIKGEKK